MLKAEVRESLAYFGWENYEGKLRTIQKATKGDERKGVKPAKWKDCLHERTTE